MVYDRAGYATGAGIKTHAIDPETHRTACGLTTPGNRPRYTVVSKVLVIDHVTCRTCLRITPTDKEAHSTT